MQHQKSWTITEIRDGESTEVLTGATNAEALVAIRRAMYGDAASLLAPAEVSVHELPLAA
ncbi:MAG TPA: hypothetical protein VGI73_00565 [Solirubrobacterales bacterium]|jgi:hypothetical protein